MEHFQNIEWSNKEGGQTGVSAWGDTPESAFKKCMESAVYFGYTNPKWWQWWRWDDINYNRKSLRKGVK
jgi:hypothetical protein